MTPTNEFVQTRQSDDYGEAPYGGKTPPLRCLKTPDEGSSREHTPMISVVLVEDDPILREHLSGWLERFPNVVLLGTFPDGENAITGIERLKPDVALLDINLPGINGIECVRKLKPRLPTTQFVMLTIHQDADVIFEALAAGATGYLVKATPREELLTALRSVHQGGSPMSNSIARKVVLSFQKAKGSKLASAKLSAREMEVLALLAQGYLMKEVAEKIGISVMTVNTYSRRIYEKLHVHSRSQAVAIYNTLL